MASAMLLVRAEALMLQVSFVFALFSLGLAIAQAPTAPSLSPASLRTPVTVQLTTVADFPDLLGGQRVRVPRVAVKQILGPRLIVVGRPRSLGIDRSYQATYEYDNLFVLLPVALTLTKEQLIVVTGEVRTVAAARALGVPLAELKPIKGKNATWMDRTVLVVADSIETEDGVLLSGVR